MKLTYKLVRLHASESSLSLDEVQTPMSKWGKMWRTASSEPTLIHRWWTVMLWIQLRTRMISILCKVFSVFSWQDTACREYHCFSIAFLASQHQAVDVRSGNAFKSCREHHKLTLLFWPCQNFVRQSKTIGVHETSFKFPQYSFQLFFLIPENHKISFGLLMLHFEAVCTWFLLDRYRLASFSRKGNSILKAECLLKSRDKSKSTSKFFRYPPLDQLWGRIKFSQ